MLSVFSKIKDNQMLENGIAVVSLSVQSETIFQYLITSTVFFSFSVLCSNWQLAIFYSFLVCNFGT